MFAERGEVCAAIRPTAGGCWGCHGSRRSPRRRSLPFRWTRASRGCRSFWESRSRCVLSARRRASDLLVPQAPAGPGRRVHSAPPARRRAVHLRRGRPQDPGFARRLGFQYRDAADFFAPARTLKLDGSGFFRKYSYRLSSAFERSRRQFCVSLHMLRVLEPALDQSACARPANCSPRSGTR